MPYTVIEDFKYGLDTRRSQLTSVLGTLAKIENAHINQGGEIEVRKAFVRIDLAPTLASTVTLVLDAIPLTDSILLVGGQTNADVANWPPTGFTYQALKRKPIPATLSGGDYPVSPNYCAQCANILAEVYATEVLHSTVFDNKAYIIAKMSDNTYAVFYDGKALDDVNEMIRILPDMATGTDDQKRLKLYCMMARAFLGDAAVDQDPVQGYTAEVRSNGSGGYNGINITGEVGRDFSVLVEGSGFSTLPTAALVSASTPDIPGKVATGYFTIQDGVSGGGSAGKITSVKVDVTELLIDTASPGTPDTINYNSTAELTAKAVVASINANTGTSGYNAKNIGPTVIIYANATGTAANEKLITVVTTGKLMIGRCSIAFSGTGFVLDFIKVDGVDLLSTTFTYPLTPGDTLTDWLETVVDDINAGTSSGLAHGIVAMRRDATLKLSKVTTISAVDGGSLPVSVSVTPTANNTGGAADGGALAVQLDRNPIEILFDVIRVPGLKGLPTYKVSGIGSTLNPVKAIVTGGTPPFKYQWLILDQNNTELSIEYPTFDMTHIRDLRAQYAVVGIQGDILINGQLKQANIYLEVTDFNGKIARSSTVPVKFLKRLIS